MNKGKETTMSLADQTKQSSIKPKAELHSTSPRSNSCTSTSSDEVKSADKDSLITSTEVTTVSDGTMSSTDERLEGSNTTSSEGFSEKMQQGTGVKPVDAEDDTENTVTVDVGSSCKTLSCRNCDKTFIKPSLLDFHYKDVHSLDDPYQCSRCSFIASEYLSMESHVSACLEPLHCVECGDMFDNHQVLVEHRIKEHSEDPLLKIKMPKLIANQLKGKRKSLRLGTSAAKRVKYKEEDMDDMAVSDEDYDDESESCLSPVKASPVKKARPRKGRKARKAAHLPEPHDDDGTGTLYICPLLDDGCDFQSMNMTSFLNHWHTHTSSDKDMYTCPYKAGGCDYQNNKMGNLRSHLKKHLRLEKYMCEEDSCDFRCNKKSDLLHHKKTEHNFVEMQEHRCEICGKLFKRRQRLTVHLRVHANDRPFICDQCGKSFASKQWMRVHQKTHHGSEKFICDVCAKEFTAKTYLAKHVKTHDSSKKFLCDVCPKAFKRSDHLQCHKRMHTGEKPFQCKVCEKTFKQICGLQAHKKVHTGEKPYICSLCARAFTYNSSLKNGLCNLCRPVSVGSKTSAGGKTGTLKVPPKGEAVLVMPGARFISTLNIDGTGTGTQKHATTPNVVPVSSFGGKQNYPVPNFDGTHVTSARFQTLPNLQQGTATNLDSALVGENVPNSAQVRENVVDSTRVRENAPKSVDDGTQKNETSPKFVHAQKFANSLKSSEDECNQKLETYSTLVPATRFQTVQNLHGSTVRKFELPSIQMSASSIICSGAQNNETAAKFEHAPNFQTIANLHGGPATGFDSAQMCKPGGLPKSVGDTLPNLHGGLPTNFASAQLCEPVPRLERGSLKYDSMPNLGGTQNDTNADRTQNYKTLVKLEQAPKFPVTDVPNLQGGSWFSLLNSVDADNG